MTYDFPKISHLDQVRDAINGSPEFIVAEREWGIVVNYMVSSPDTFPPIKTSGGSAAMRAKATEAKILRRECRGLIFNHNGDVISRPYHKFFNVGEREETLINNIDLSKPHVILEKLDGSMVRPIPIGDAYRLGTKMGITDVSMQAETWLVDHPNYDQFIRSCIASGCTPIFEWCSRKQRIVIDYPQDRLVLTAIRNTMFGNYMGIHGMRGLAETFDLDMVKEYSGTVSSMNHLVTETSALLDQEGWIIRFDDGHMYKIKADDYRLKHSAKDKILRENGVIELILDEKIDDIKPILSDDDRDQLDAFESKFWHGIQQTAENWHKANLGVRRLYADRKDFALSLIIKDMDGHLKTNIFKAWDTVDFDWHAAVVASVRKNLGSSTKVSEVRHLFGGAVWTYGLVMDN